MTQNAEPRALLSGILGSTPFAAGAIIVCGLAAYHNTFSCPFIFDDLPTIVENRYIRHLWPIWEAAWSPPEVATAGRPVLALSFVLNYAISRQKA